MRAYYVLLLAAAILLVNTFEVVSAATVPRHEQLASVESLGALQKNNGVSTRGFGKRLLRSHTADEEDAQNVNNTEERGITGITVVTNFVNRLKKTVDKEEKLKTLLLKGENSFSKLYKKETPFNLFTRFKFGDMSDEEKAASALYQMWGKYFTYWVKRNDKRSLESVDKK